VSVEAGVLPLVVRAGGGSVRDTLSVLDQLIAGSPDSQVAYDRAVALLGYTHGELLATAMEALATSDGPATFQALDRVIHTGQDPRRFAEDLLEYVRDLIVVDAAKGQAAGLLPGVSPGALEQMAGIAAGVGSSRLSEVADVVNDALTGMTGATSPKLHLELLMARLLVAMGDNQTHNQPAPVAQTASAPTEAPTPVSPAPVAETERLEPWDVEGLQGAWPAILETVAEKKRAVWTALTNTEVVALDSDVVTIGFPTLSSAEILKKPQGPGLPVNAELVRDAITSVTGHRVRFKVQELPGAKDAVLQPEVPAEAEALEEPESTPAMPPVEPAAAEKKESEVSAPDTASWPTVAPPTSEVENSVEAVSVLEDSVLEESVVQDTVAQDSEPTTSQLSQVGEAVIREVLGGQLISEHPVDQPGEK